MSNRFKLLSFSVLILAGITQVSHADTINRYYEQAISNTAVMRAKNVKPLTPLTDMEGHFIVWTDYMGYQPNAHYQMPLNLFVSRIEEMHQACHPFTSSFGGRGDNLKNRINQLLGLPLYSSPQKFVEISMYVDQPNNTQIANYSASSVGQALFRPCGNPNVRDNSCGEDFASDVTPDFKQWIYQKTRQSYHESVINPQTQKINYGYPWTDLGYTYDWGSSNKFGVEEFVVKKGAEVNVIRQADGSAYISAEDFCKNSDG